MGIIRSWELGLKNNGRIMFRARDRIDFYGHGRQPASYGDVTVVTFTPRSLKTNEKTYKTAII